MSDTNKMKVAFLADEVKRQARAAAPAVGAGTTLDALREEFEASFLLGREYAGIAEATALDHFRAGRYAEKFYSRQNVPPTTAGDLRRVVRGLTATRPEISQPWEKEGPLVDAAKLARQQNDEQEARILAAVEILPAENAQLKQLYKSMCTLAQKRDPDR